MSPYVSLTVNGHAVVVTTGTSVAAAIAHARQPFQRSGHGMPRAPLCGMGVCFECRARIDGVAQQRTCMLPVHAGMQVLTHD